MLEIKAGTWKKTIYNKPDYCDDQAQFAMR